MADIDWSEHKVLLYLGGGVWTDDAINADCESDKCQWPGDAKDIGNSNHAVPIEDIIEMKKDHDEYVRNNG